MHIDASSAEARAALAALPPSPPAREDFEVGQTLRSSTGTREYKVLEVKKGGFGAVYVARSERSGITYALKTFQARYLWSDADRERFEREAVTWVMLERHPHIVAAHWAERIEGFPCLVLEYVPGGDLGQLLGRGPLPLQRALELGLQFCDGMEYAHRKLGIVHRDVKPANCLLTEEGMLKVTDFGLARAFGAAVEDALNLGALGVEVRSQYTTAAGTPQYMAPEQFRAGAELDTRTDIYAFGIMLYQMLTGDLPVSGAIAQAHIRAHGSGHEFGEPVLQLIMQCVQPEVGRRPLDFGQVRQGLGAAYEALTGAAASAPAQPMPMGAEQWKGKGVALLALGRPEEAIACYDRGLEIAPRDSGLWQNKGAALGALGRWEEEITCIDRGLEIAPHDSYLWQNKGVALGALGRWEEEIACYDRGLEIAPRDSGLWQNKGVALRALGRPEEAIACYDCGLEIAPRDSGLWKNKGVALGALGRWEEEIACYDRGLEIAPRDSGLWKNKGLALQALGRAQEAQECLRRAQELAGG